MNRNIDPAEGPIELGLASVETRGVSGPPRDEKGQYFILGLSDD